MKRRHHSKSTLFLMELLLNLLLFCFLCGCGLQFFIKSDNLIKNADILQNAVRITTSIASVYETGDGDFTALCELFELADITEHSLSLYYDETYIPCDKANSTYYALVVKEDGIPCKAAIDFCDSNGDIIYSIQVCNYTPLTLSNVPEKEVPAP